MKLANFFKTPAERKRYAIDYSDWLDSGETITGCVFAVSPSTTNTLQIDAYSISASGTEVVMFVNYGDAGSAYTVDVKTTTSGGQIKEDTVLFTVRSA
jgi:hypothetical protein